MIRLILFISIIAALSSCSILRGRNGNIRYVKTDNRNELIDKSNQSGNLAENVNGSNIKSEALTKKEEIKETQQLTDRVAEEIELPEQVISSVEDTLKPEEGDDEEISAIMDQAVRAENHANASFYLFIGGLISILLPFIGIIPTIIGIFFFASSTNSRYITKFGESRRRAAKSLLVIDSFLIFLWTFLIILLVFIL